MLIVGFAFARKNAYDQNATNTIILKHIAPRSITQTMAQKFMVVLFSKTTIFIDDLSSVDETDAKTTLSVGWFWICIQSILRNATSD